MKNGIDIAIIDYGLSNLYSVDLACKKAGINSKITSSSEDIKKSKGIILPGVGAFDHAMHNLKEKSWIMPFPISSKLVNLFRYMSWNATYYGRKL